MLAGSARDALEAQEKAQALVHQQEIGGKNRELERKRQAMEAQVAVLRAEFEVEQAEAAKTIGQDLNSRRRRRPGQTRSPPHPTASCWTANTSKGAER